MKNLKSILTILALMIGVASYAQNPTRVIALVTKASWCPTCIANGERMGKEVFSAYTNGDVKVMANDLSNETSIAASKPALEEAGIAKIAAKSKATGVITLIDAKTKKVVGTVSVAKPTEQVKAAIDKSLKGL